MTANRMMSELDFTKTQLAFFFVIILLSLDSVNPVKMLLHVFPTIASWHVAAVSSICMIYIFFAEMQELLYFAVRIFFHSILSIFFREVEVVGRDNIPPRGPVVFTSNHANQFIDGVTIMCTCQRKISYLVAEKSWKRPIIGHLAWAMGAVPVRRAQDWAKRGTGAVTMERRAAGAGARADAAASGAAKADASGNGDCGAGDEAEARHGGRNEKRPQSQQTNGETKGEQPRDGPASSPPPSSPSSPPSSVVVVRGVGTRFLAEVHVGDKIRLPGSPLGYKIIAVDGDDELRCSDTEETASLPVPTEPTPYDVLPRVDQKVVYEKVLDKLASGGTIGIFPEGGSHDRTDLLPLKVGVALIAYSALEKDGINIPIVPVGLNYFRAHRFRGRAIVEYGTPTYLDPNTLKQYKKGGAAKRALCNALLERIQDSMRSVLVSAPDYGSLRLIHAARRLYRRVEHNRQTAGEKQDLSRRFAEGYKRLLLQVGGDPPEAWLDLQRRILDYQRELDELGMRDYQVPGLDRDAAPWSQSYHDGDAVRREMRVHGHILRLVFTLLLAALPAVLLNLPVGLVARFYSNHRRKVALAASKVKIKGYDVMLSEKVLLCIVLVPSLWFVYGLLLYFFTDLDGTTIALVILSMPLFSYIGIMAAEAGMVDLKDLRPFVMRLFPSARRRLAALPAVRRELQSDLRQFVKELGPSLGEIYYGKNLDWKLIQEKTRRASRKGGEALTPPASPTTPQGGEGKKYI